MWLSLIAALVVIVLAYKYFSRKKDFWKKYGILEIDTSPAASMLDTLLGRKSMFEVDDYVYDKLGSEKFCGIYDMGKPAVIVKDLDLIKKVLIKDFDYFMDRRQLFTHEDGSLFKMLPSLQGQEWKGVRASVSPTFTTGKIRRMMNIFNDIAKEWVKELERQAKSNNSGSVDIEAATTATQFTVDVIASSVFGMNAGAVKDKNSKFAKTAKILTNTDTIQILKLGMRFAFPKLSQFLGIKFINQKAMEFFEGILSQSLKQRLSGLVKRNDFLQLLVEAKKGELKAAGNDELSTFEKEAILNSPDGGKKQWLTEDVMNAQSMVFFFAGFSTTSDFITFALYSLALYPAVQEKLREEVETIVKPDGTFDYDDLGQLVYLDMVVCEVLRKFSATGRLERICVKEYRDPETGLVVPTGTMVLIPLNAIHHDRRFYDNPKSFDPENFSPEKKASMNPYAYMPYEFGIGPRNCIGMRFALVEGKTAICHIVHNFKIEPTSKTPVPLQGKPAGLQLAPPTGLELKLISLKRQ